MRRTLDLLALVLLLAAAPASAQDVGPRLEPLPGEEGWIGVRVVGNPNATLTLYDNGVALGAVTLDASGQAERPRLTPWTCPPGRHELTAVDEAQRSATLAVDTPSCAKRLRMRVAPRRPRAGRTVTVTVRDRWGLGDLEPRVCARALKCRDVAFEGASRATFRFTPRAVGRWRISLDHPGVPDLRATVRVRPHKRGLRILATGDSMIQYVDSALARRLERGRRRVRSDAHISTGISKPSALNWMSHAARSARSYKPDATVVFLGANDGFPIGGESCCGERWVDGYAARVRRMMRSYARRGAGAVYWLTLPVPDRADFKPIYRAVNRAIRKAAGRFPGVVRVVDTEKFFTPGGTYRATVRWKGRTRTVRQGDGVHLNQTGAAIAAALVIRAMRRDGVVG